MVNLGLESGGILFNLMFLFGCPFFAIFGRGREGPNNGRGKYNNTGNRPTYHLCDKLGHIVRKY